MNIGIYGSENVTHLKVSYIYELKIIYQVNVNNLTITTGKNILRLNHYL